MNRPPYRGQIGRTEIITAPGWAVTLGAIIAGALGIAVFLASASLILMLAPVIIGAAFYIRWRVRRALRKMAEAQGANQQDGGDSFIEGEYRVINDGEDRYRR